MHWIYWTPVFCMSYQLQSSRRSYNQVTKGGNKGVMNQESKTIIGRVWGRVSNNERCWVRVANQAQAWQYSLGSGTLSGTQYVARHPSGWNKPLATPESLLTNVELSWNWNSLASPSTSMYYAWPSNLLKYPKNDEQHRCMGWYSHGVNKVSVWDAG